MVRNMAKLRASLALGFTDLKSVFNDISTGYTPTNPQAGSFRDYSKLENLDTPTPLDGTDCTAFFVYPPNMPTTDTVHNANYGENPNFALKDTESGHVASFIQSEKPPLTIEQPTRNYHTLCDDFASDNTQCTVINQCQQIVHQSTRMKTSILDNYQKPNGPYYANYGNTVIHVIPNCDDTRTTPCIQDNKDRPDWKHGILADERRIDTTHKVPGIYKPVNQNQDDRKAARSKILEKSFACPAPDCIKRFARIDELKRHQRTHSDVRQFVCDICNKGFTRSDHLMTHRRTHTGERPYPCKLCDRRFARSDERNRHMKVHFREKTRSDRRSRHTTQPLTVKTNLEMNPNHPVTNGYHFHTQP